MSRNSLATDSSVKELIYYAAFKVQSQLSLSRKKQKNLKEDQQWLSSVCSWRDLMQGGVRVWGPWLLAGTTPTPTPHHSLSPLPYPCRERWGRDWRCAKDFSGPKVSTGAGWSLRNIKSSVFCTGGRVVFLHWWEWPARAMADMCQYFHWAGKQTLVEAHMLLLAVEQLMLVKDCTSYLSFAFIP